MTIQFDAIKIAYKQDKEGFVVTFRIHPSDDHQAIGNAELGSQWQLTCVELNEDGNATPASSTPERPGRGEGEASRDASPKRLVQQAAIACRQPKFQTWVKQCLDPNHEGGLERTQALVREYCGVKSRSEILPGTEAAQRWDRLYSRFVAWDLVE